jgi:hypothetical protein
MTVPRSFCRTLVLAMLAAAAPLEAQRLPSVPSLQTGQALVYRLDLSGSRSTKVESRVTTPQSPPREDLNAQGLIQIEVAEAGAKGFRLKTYLSDRRSAQPSSNAPETQVSSPDKLVEVFIASNGTASQIKGFADLGPALQIAWTAWLNRFTSLMTFPKRGVRPGQRWKISEQEASPSPIAGLFWERRYEYVKQQGCGSPVKGPAGGAVGHSPPSADTCAVIFVHAQLEQKSSPKDSTPQDYRLRGLKTAGAASGTNSTILYISLKTGLLVRSTEEIEQKMDATVALADGSNRVRYLIEAKSRSQIELLSDVPREVR